MAEHLMCELSVPGRVGFQFPDPDVPAAPLPEDLIRDDLPSANSLKSMWCVILLGYHS